MSLQFSTRVLLCHARPECNIARLYSTNRLSATPALVQQGRVVGCRHQELSSLPLAASAHIQTTSNQYQTRAQESSRYITYLGLRELVRSIASRPSQRIIRNQS